MTEHIEGAAFLSALLCWAERQVEEDGWGVGESTMEERIDDHLEELAYKLIALLESERGKEPDND